MAVALLATLSRDWPPRVCLLVGLTGLRLALGMSLMLRLIQEPQLERVLLGFILAIVCVVIHWELGSRALQASLDCQLLWAVFEVHIWLNSAELGCMCTAAGVVALYCMLHHLHLYSQPLSLGLGRMLSFRKHFQEGEVEAYCPVCLEDIAGPGVTARLCGHQFHKECILRAMGVSSRCPVCRHPLD
jgi:hypothetical protein